MLETNKLQGSFWTFYYLNFWKFEISGPKIFYFNKSLFIYSAIYVQSGEKVFWIFRIILDCLN
jgi:hypothetical protein